ncbi:MAG: right-handed parallel beta-helix repeat-containing protein [Pseudomonadota bacterium]
MRMVRWAVFLLPGLLGCPPVDERPDASVVACMEQAPGACVEAPAAPTLPTLGDWTCAAGWQAVAAYSLDDDERRAVRSEPHSICEPVTPPTTCAAGQLPALGSALCEELGDGCPADGWPQDLPTSGSILFVQAGASGGDGSSRDRPFGTIAAALAQAVNGDTVVLAAGTYTEAVVISRAVTLRGACARDVILEAPSASDTRGTVELTGAGGSVLRDLTITGPRVGLWILNNSDVVRVQGVHVRQARSIGVFASDGGHGLLHRVRVEDTQADDLGEMGRGVQVRTAGQLRLERCTVEHNRDVGITVSGASCRLDLVDSVVRDTQPQTSDGAWGLGLELLSGARASLERCLLSHNRNTGIASADTGTVLEMLDVVIQDTQPQQNNNQYGGGMECAAGATVQGQRVLLQRNHAIALVTGGRGTTVELSDLVVRQTEARASDGVFGNGLSLQMGSEVTLRRAAFAGNRFADILASSPGSALTLEDVLLRQTQPQQVDGTRGSGLEVNSSARVQGHRLLIERTADSGLHLSSMGTQVEIRDLTVRDSGNLDPAQHGYGVNVQTGAQVLIERARIERPRTIGLNASSSSTSLTVRDLTLADVRADPLGAFGRGLNVQEGAYLLLERARVERAREVAVFGGGAGTTLDIRHLQVLDTQPSNSAMAEGRGVSMQDGALGWVGPARIDASREVGAFAIHAGSSLTLEQTWISGTQRALAEPFGHGVTARDGARLDLLGCAVVHNANVGVAYANASGRVIGTRIADNAVGIFAGEGSSIHEVADAPEQVGPLEVYIDETTALDSNQTRVGTGTIPLPDLLLSAPD